MKKMPPNVIDEKYKQNLEPLEEMNDEESSTVEDFLAIAENHPPANDEDQFDDVAVEEEDEPANDSDFEEEIDSHQGHPNKRLRNRQFSMF